jgi:putative hydrolase of the HAD superfamily
MIKVVLFDCDGPIIRHNKYFSQRLREECDIELNVENLKSFFSNEFLLCETGKADLKQELAKRLQAWGWKKSVEELMDFWFKGEAEVDLEMKEYILSLRERGIECFLSTNNEKYRTEYLWNVVGLKNFLDKAYSSSSVGYLKPQTEFWHEVYKDFPNVPKSEVLVLDDQESTIHSAKEFGFKAEFYTDFESIKKKIDAEIKDFR